MTNIIVVFPKIENAKKHSECPCEKQLFRHGGLYHGAQALSQLEDYNEAIVICSYRWWTWSVWSCLT